MFSRLVELLIVKDESNASPSDIVMNALGCRIAPLFRVLRFEEQE